MLNPGGPVTSADWLAAVDVQGLVTGSKQFNVVSGDAGLILNVNKKDANGGQIDCVGSVCEKFFLILWDASSGMFYTVSNPSNPLFIDYVEDPMRAGWIDGYSDIDAFTNNQTLTFNGPGYANFQDLVNFILPVDFLSFTARNDNAAVVLDWSTATETDNDYFAVERSADGRDWSELNRVSGQGTTELVNEYQYRDLEPLSGRSLYRLRQVDYDGAYAYSALVSVTRGGKNDGEAISVFPNPVTTGQLTAELSGDWTAGADLTLELHDLAGRIISRQLSAAASSITFPLENVPAGAYLLSVKRDGRSVSQRVMVR
ncbi:MAG: T9SS type A sorting domain-containing protein [Saprospiraceae bacterium]